MRLVILSLLLTSLWIPTAPSTVLAACTPDRSSVTETHKLGMWLSAQSGVEFTALKATFELNEPYVHAGTSYMYLGMRAVGYSDTVNFGVMKSPTSGNWQGYIYLREFDGVVQSFTFDPYSYDSGGAIALEVRNPSGNTWRFYAAGSLILTATAVIVNRNESYVYASTANRRSQMPGGTSDHTSITSAWYWTNVGNASWSGTPVGYNATYFGFTKSPFEIWDKFCAT